MDEPNEKPIDLAAFNINRGRDHGIPSYINYVKKCSNSIIKTFEDLTPIMDAININKLRSVYK